MFELVHNISIGGKRLNLLEGITVNKSVYTLANTAEIVLPSSYFNRALEIESKIKRGDPVNIAFGYDIATSEFTGYLQNISINGGCITLQCEDEIYNLRKPLKNKELNNTSLKSLITHVLNELNNGFTCDCSYDFQYKKFVIRNATALDVLKKVQNETKASIYLENKVLHVHPAESLYGNTEYFDFSLNVLEDNLKYMSEDERKFEIEVEGLLNDGTRRTVLVGTTGGDRRSVKVYGVINTESLKKRGVEELKRFSFTGYEGNIKTWLEPYVKPTDAAVIIDKEYPARKGKYFVTAVQTTFNSDTGGTRKIELGVMLNTDTRR